MQYRIYIRFALIAVVLSVPLAFVLPVEVSFENGLIENVQVIVLIVGAIWLSAVRLSMKWFRRFCSAGLVLIALRELSWGRVFFPIEMEKYGSVFIGMADYKYCTHVYVFLVAYVSAMIFMLVKLVPIKRLIESRQLLAAFAVIIMATIFACVGDHGWIIGKKCGQILEEFNELIVYMTLPVAALYYCRADTGRNF